MRHLPLLSHDIAAVINAEIVTVANDIPVDGWEPVLIGGKIPVYFRPGSENDDYVFPEIRDASCMVQYVEEYGGFILSVEIIKNF